jgi:hypothetical protein
MALPNENNAKRCLTDITRALNHFAFFRPLANGFSQQWPSWRERPGFAFCNSMQRAVLVADAVEASPGVSSADVETTHGRGG